MWVLSSYALDCWLALWIVGFWCVFCEIVLYVDLVVGLCCCGVGCLGLLVMRCLLCMTSVVLMRFAFGCALFVLCIASSSVNSVDIFCF